MTAPTEPGYVREGRATETGVAGGMCVCEGWFCVCMCVKAGWCGYIKLSGGGVFLSLEGVGEEGLGSAQGNVCVSVTYVHICGHT